MINLRPMTGGLSQVLYASNRSAMLSSKIPQALAVHVWPGCTGIASVSVPVEQSRRLAAMGYAGQHQAVAQGQQRSVEHQRAAAGFRSWLAQTPAMCAGQLAGCDR
jgi:hypothetical protein